MMVNSETTFLLFLALLVPGSLLDISGRQQMQQNQGEIGCFMPGECVESSIVSLIFPETVEECLDWCKHTESCLYFTHYQVDFVCLLLSECSGGLSTANCKDCVSGDVKCEMMECNEPGKCVLVKVCDQGV